MKIRKLDKSFYRDNSNLVEALDCINGKWIAGKTRGYGVVVITFKGLTFAIPLRSTIRHRASYVTVRSNEPRVLGKGLDFSKALLISKSTHVSKVQFEVPENEHKKLKSKEVFITGKFQKYVTKYVNAVNNTDCNVLNGPEYRYTTLKNYHQQLGIQSEES